MKRKILSIVLTLMMVVGLLPMGALAAASIAAMLMIPAAAIDDDVARTRSVLGT